MGLLMAVAPASAAMSPTEIAVACHSLARMAFDLKDLVNVVAQKRNPGPFQVCGAQPWHPEVSEAVVLVAQH